MTQSQHAATIITGEVSIGSIVTFLTSVVGFLTVWLQSRQTHRRVEEINRAVNGVGPDKKAMVVNVQELHDEMVASSRGAAKTPGPAAPAAGTSQQEVAP
jgi:hypothetical protein